MSLTNVIDGLPRRTTWTVSSIATLAAASAVGLALAYVVPGGTAAAAASVPVPVAAPAAPVWTVANDIAGTSCEARRGPRLTGASHALDLGVGCASVSERLAEAVVWKEGRDGSVSLSDARGRLVVAFAPAEGPAMEAYRPAQMMLSLARQ